MDSSAVQELVVKAFVLDVIAHKEGCAGLTDERASDFLLAATNSGRHFARFAKTVADDAGEAYGEYLACMRRANLDKSSKTVNLGLVEVMLYAVESVARHISLSRVLDEERPRVVARIIEGRAQGWRTSRKESRKGFSMEPEPTIREFLRSVPEHHEDSVSLEVASDAAEGFCVLEEMRSEILAAPTVIQGIEMAYAQRVGTRTAGWLSDLTAAATFLALAERER